MIKIAWLLLLTSVGIILWGVHTNNKYYRTLGFKLGAVALALIIASGMFDIQVFPEL